MTVNLLPRRLPAHEVALTAVIHNGAAGAPAGPGAVRNAPATKTGRGEECARHEKDEAPAAVAGASSWSRPAV
jgi:hypothetical protein